MFDKALSDQAPVSAAAPAAPPAPNLAVTNSTAIFGANVRRVREALGLSCDQVAARLGFAADQIAEIERDVGGKVDLDLIILMTKQLEISYADLLRGIS